MAIMIGNSDDKLTQEEWSGFCEGLNVAILATTKTGVYFSGASSPFSRWQNACVVVELSAQQEQELKLRLISLKHKYEQDSIAIIAGETQFI